MSVAHYKKSTKRGVLVYIAPVTIELVIDEDDDTFCQVMSFVFSSNGILYVGTVKAHPKSESQFLYLTRDGAVPAGLKVPAGM